MRLVIGTVVDKAAGSKRKRSLADFGGNHKRWLEEAWREDMHEGLGREELHKRWFGPSVIDWLKGVLAGVSNGLDTGNTYKDDFTVVLLNEQYGPCTIRGVKVDAKLDVRVQTHVEVETNFGLTIITTLGAPVDLKNSYLYFRNKGEVTARFTLDALATAAFDSGDILLLSADKFGAGFSVPGILTVGPNFKLFGQVEGAATVGAHVESNVRLASWDVRQTYPTEGNDWDPTATEKPNRDGTQEILKPDFRYQVSANGFITAHVKPTFTFGIDFSDRFIKVPSCTANLVADGYVTFYAEASTGTAGSSFCYGVNAGADLYASLDAPKVFGWDLSAPRYQIAQADPIQIVARTCPISSRDLGHSWDSLPEAGSPLNWSDYSEAVATHSGVNDLGKRGQVYGPLLSLKPGIGCPSGDETPANIILPCPLCGPDTAGEDGGPVRMVVGDEVESCYYELPSGNSICPASLLSRSLNDETFQANSTSILEQRELVERTDKPINWYFTAGGSEKLDCGPYPSCAAAAAGGSVGKWFGFPDPRKACDGHVQKFARNKINPGDYATDHVYEANMLISFFQYLRGDTKFPFPSGYSKATEEWISGRLLGTVKYSGTFPPLAVDGAGSLWFALTRCLGGSGSGENRLALVDSRINGRKKSFFVLEAISATHPSTANDKYARIWQRNVS